MFLIWGYPTWALASGPPPSISHILLYVSQPKLGGGGANAFSPQITNLQILGLNPHQQNCKFMRYASPQISNPQMSFE